MLSKTPVYRLILLICVFFLAACQAADLISTDPYAVPQINDPLEERNRLTVNRQLEFSLTTGLALTNWYIKHIPDFPARRFRDFSTNLREPRNFIASLLQFKIEKAVRSLMRFSINTVFGVFGFIDILKAAGVEEANEDFGQVFATWGFQQGDFIILPTGLPSTSRDFLGSLFDVALDPGILLGTTVSPAWLALYLRHPFNAIDSYARNVPLINSIAQTSIDPYLTFRSTYLSIRHRQIVENPVDYLYGQ